jgi:glycosyltransferase involved in cell wall biosynthesis
MRLVLERDPKVRLLLVGGGPLRDDIERRIDRLGMRAACALTSNRSDIGRLLVGSDVFFFPSAWEGLPGAPLEALAAGLPLVTSDIPSMREIAPYFPGDVSMAPPNDIGKHANNIRRALEEPDDGARSRRQHRFATSPFTLETSVETYREIYGLDSNEHVG